MSTPFTESNRMALLTEWYARPYAQYVQQHIGEHLKSYLKRMPIQEAVTVGLPLDTERPWPVPFAKQISLVNDVGVATKNVSLQDNLPLSSDSHTCLIYHHLLDVLDNPYQMLREANRVLDDAGYLIVIAFNPISLYGLNRGVRLPWDMLRKSVPWSLKSYSQARLRNWLRVLEFVPALTDSVGVIPPVVGDHDAVLLRKTDPLLTRLFSTFGMVSINLYRKSLAPVTPIRTRWQVQPQKLSAAKLQPVSRGIVASKRKTLCGLAPCAAS